MEERGHPGVPPYEEGPGGRPHGPLAAKVVSKQADRTAEAPSVILGDIVERTPPAGSIRPPGAPAAEDKQVNEEEDRLLEEIHRENDQVLGRMTAEEILAKQEELKKMLPPKLVQKWSSH